MLNAIFTSNMVFPAGKRFRVFGDEAAPIKVTLADKKAAIKNENGKWVAEFEPMDYGGGYELRVEYPDSTTTLENVFVGEVYLFAGQSNMQFKMWESTTKEGEDNDKIRIFYPDRIEKTDKFTPKDGWLVCTKEMTPEISAIAYHTATELTKKGIAVGIVNCYQGASVIESWSPKGAFDKISDLTLEQKHGDHGDPEYAAWQGEGTLYEYAFLQIAPFAFSGVVWYQGESDTSAVEGEVYLKELAEMIKIWRHDLRDGELPFVVVQLADFTWGDPIGWKLVQEAQLKAQKEIPFVKTVISRDICESDCIHPPTKDKLAKRIAKALMEKQLDRPFLE